MPDSPVWGTSFFPPDSAGRVSLSMAKKRQNENSQMVPITSVLSHGSKVTAAGDGKMIGARSSAFWSDIWKWPRRLENRLLLASWLRGDVLVVDSTALSAGSAIHKSRLPFHSICNRLHPSVTLFNKLEKSILCDKPRSHELPAPRAISAA